MKQALPILTALALCCLSGCGSAAPREEAAPAAAVAAPAPESDAEPTAALAPEPTPEPSPEITVTPPPVPDFDLAAAKYPADTTVLTVDGRSVDWESFFAAFRERAEYFYIYYGITDYSTPMDEDGETIGSWIVDQAVIDLRAMVMFEGWAEELGIGLTEEDEAEIEAEFREYADRYYGGDADAMFADLGYSEAYVRRKGAYSKLNDKLFSYFFGEEGAALGAEDVLDYMTGHDYLYGKRILLKTLTDAGDPLEQSVRDEKLALAEELLATLRAVDSAELPKKFDELMREYSEDPNLERFPDGFYFTPGEIEAMSDTVSALAEGELSEVVPCDYGYQIIYRPAMDPDHIFDADEGGKPYTLRYFVAYTLFGNVCNERYDAQTVEWNEDFADLDISALFAAE
ncbi:MAG: peptidylprolyl isomerase [Oscillospiraceae bacterium]|nr:peptidylprolyl isomerase [Oscillospiraceae bacterium]